VLSPTEVFGLVCAREDREPVEVEALAARGHRDWLERS
jgi:hypothetical protein